MEIKVKIVPPTMPSFIIIEQAPGMRQDGIHNSTIPVGELTDEQALEYTELWKETFLAHHARCKEKIERQIKSGTHPPHPIKNFTKDDDTPF